MQLRYHPHRYHADPAWSCCENYFFDCLRYMIEVGWNPHNIPMEKQLHGRRRLNLKGEPGRISLHGYMYWSSSLQGTDKWSVNIFVTPKHWRTVAIYTISVFREMVFASNKCCVRQPWLALHLSFCSLPTSAGTRWSLAMISTLVKFFYCFKQVLVSLTMISIWGTLHFR